MKCRIPKLLALVMSLFLGMSANVFTVFADGDPTPPATTYTPIGGTTTFVKNLVVDSDANKFDAVALDEADAERNDPSKWVTPVEFHTRLESRYPWLR